MGPLPFSSTHRTDCAPGQDCVAVYNEQPHTAALVARQWLELVPMGLATGTPSWKPFRVRAQPSVCRWARVQ